MGEIDLKKLDVSIEYVKRMADGRNPINNEPLAEESVLNNPNVIRCLYFIEDVLKQVQAVNGNLSASSKKKREDFPLEYLNKYVYKQDLSISRLVDQLNEGLDLELYKKLSRQAITRWLKANGYLTEVDRGDENKTQTLPTEKGVTHGIYTQERESQYGRMYLVVLYNKNAQEFLVRNMENILDGMVE